MSETTSNGDRPVADLARELSAEVARLARSELRLAQLEMMNKGKRAGLGAGMLGGGGVVALYGAAAVLAGIVLLLAKVVPAWGAALIVGGALFGVAGALAALGRKQMRHAAPPVPQQTVGSVKADISEITERAQR